MRRLEHREFCEPQEKDPFEDSPVAIHCRPDANARGLIMFVHGMGGHAYGPKSTWGYFPRFVFEDFADYDVGLYSYRTLSGRLKFWRSITLEQEATVFAHVLRDMTGYDSVVMVGHSMGGLLCEAALAYLIETRQTEFLAHMRGMILMATPQAGSLRVPRFLRWLKDFAALQPHGQFVERIHQTLSNYVSLTEPGPDGKPFYIPTWAILGAHDFWVDRMSSRFNLPDSRIKVVRGSHRSLVKPASKADDAYRFVHDCIVAAMRPENLRTAGQRRMRASVPAAPDAPAPIIGRSEMVAKLLDALRPSEPARNAITAALVGEPGQGITTLAAAVAHHHEIEKNLPDGALWITLGENPDILTGLSSWGRRLGADLSCYDTARVRSLALSLLLADRRMLLVIDEVRRVEDAKPFLAGGPGCRVLVTTSNPAIARELAGDNCVHLEKLPAGASLQLLRRLAPHAFSGNDEELRSLATALEDSPLELNLVGRLLRQAGAGQPVFAEIEELRRTDTDPHGEAFAARRAVLRVGYTSLPNDALKRAFRFLGVFGARPLTFPVDAAAAVAGVPQQEALRTFDALVERGLVNCAGRDRLFLHASVSNFALEALDQNHETETAQRNHARYYLQFAEKHASRDWQLVEEELDQIGRGFLFADRLRDNAAVLAYARSMVPFLFHRGLLDEAARWTKAALLSASELGDRSAEAFLERMSGRIHWQRGQKTSAVECFERCLRICETGGNDRELVRVLMNLGVVYQSRRDWPAALSYYERARAEAERTGERVRLGQALRGIGFIRHREGDWAAALDYYDRSAQVLGQLPEGDPHRSDLAQSLANAAELEAERGDFEQALQHHQRALAIREETGDRAAAAQSHIAIGEIRSRQGDLEQAQRHYESSLKICQEIADIQGLSVSLNRVADLLGRKRDMSRADAFRRESQRLSTALLQTQQQAAGGKGA